MSGEFFDALMRARAADKATSMGLVLALLVALGLFVLSAHYYQGPNRGQGTGQITDGAALPGRIGAPNHFPLPSDH
jgi:hypothetical protein